MINSICAPTYRIPKHMSMKLLELLQLENTYITVNSTQVASELLNITVKNIINALQWTLRAYMLIYVNLPINEIIYITLSQLLTKGIDHVSTK